MLKTILVLLISTLSFISCNQPESSSANQDCIGSFAHNVYFWLENPESEADKALFLKNLKAFIEQSPYIQAYHIGKPAATFREVIDNSYSFSLVLTFKDKAAQDAYQEEPAHKKLIAETSHLWSRVVVYDSEQIVAK